MPGIDLPCSSIEIDFAGGKNLSIEIRLFTDISKFNRLSTTRDERNMDDIDQMVLDYLRSRPSAKSRASGLTGETRLMESGILDSLELMSLVTYLEERYRFNLPGNEYMPENFKTPRSVAEIDISRLHEQRFRAAPESSSRIFRNNVQNVPYRALPSARVLWERHVRLRPCKAAVSSSCGNGSHRKMTFRLCRPIHSKPNTLSLPTHFFRVVTTCAEITRSEEYSAQIKAKDRNRSPRPHSDVLGVAMSLQPITLVLEKEDDSATEEYRIVNGGIQVRQLHRSRVDEAEWRIVSPAELTAHVEKNTIVSQWLRLRLGWRGLLRACVADQQGLYGDAAEKNPRAA
jgi:acyl carrier protein